MSTLYFCPDLDDEKAYSIEDILDMMKDEGLKEVHIFKPTRDTDSDAFFCYQYQESGLKSESDCGKDCKGYIPRNGKSGCCKHRRACYEPGEEFILNINGKIKKINEDDKESSL